MQIALHVGVDVADEHVGTLGRVDRQLLLARPLRQVGLGRPGRQPGDVDVVVHTIVLVVAKDKKGQKDLSMPEVKEAISSTLKTRKEQLLRAAYLSALRNDAQVTNVLAKQIVQAGGKVPASAAAKP